MKLRLTYTMTLFVVFALAYQVSAGNFQNIAHGINIGSTQLLNEITLGIDERMQVVHLGNFTQRVHYGQNFASTNFWTLWQGKVESICTNFVDTNNVPTDGITITNYTLGGWRRAAGITNGFRRATNFNPAVNDWTDYNDPMYTNAGYGFYRVGDIVGVWLFVDMQNGLTAQDQWYDQFPCAWTTCVSQNARIGFGTSTVSSATAWTQSVTAYTAGWVGVTNNGIYYKVQRNRYEPGGGPEWEWQENRMKGDPHNQNIIVPANTTFDWDLYFYCIDVRSGIGTNAAADLDSTGYSTNVLFLFDNAAAASATSITASTIGAYDTAPYSFAPTNGWQGDNFNDRTDGHNFKTSDAFWLFSGNFTHE